MNNTFDSRDTAQRDTAQRIAGWSLITASVGFMAVFAYLARAFGYPDVLHDSANVVLPKLLSLGQTGRAVWALYALLPLLLIPAAVGASAAWRDHAPNAMRAAAVFGVVSALSMLLGLARWPTIHWELALAYNSAGPDARLAIDSLFNGLNAFFGNFIGEFVGELALSSFFVVTAVAIRRTGYNVWWSRLGLAVGLTGLIASLRNVTPLVDPIAQLNNIVLPVWLIALGIVLLRQIPIRRNTKGA